MKSLNCLLLGLLVAGLAPRSQGAGPGLRNGSDDAFSSPRIFELKLQIGDSSLEALRRAPKDYVKATLTEGDRPYTDAGARYKGTNHLSGGKPAFTIKFNEFKNGQRFHALSRILLDPSPQDPTYLTGLLVNDLFRSAGVPAPRDTFARVELNGKDLGLYVLSEGVNRDFLGRHFERTKGNLYEGDGHDVTEMLDKDSGDEHKDQPDVEVLAKASKEADPAQRWKKLEPVLDLDRFISFLAVEVLTWHTNGYAIGAQKYRLYHDPASDRMIFLPHGTEVAFGVTDGTLFPPMTGLVARAVLQTPEGKRLYRERLAKVLTSHLKTDSLQARINELVALLRPALARFEPGRVGAFDAAVAQLRDRIPKRAYFVEQELKKQ